MVKQIWKRLLCLFLILAAASALCLSLNRWDNKYTRAGTRGIDGILTLSRAELQENNLHFLVNGWTFYPSILLTPEELSQSGGGRYMFYTSIGERTRFDTGSDNPHGCGTYVLTLVLPEEPGYYALEFPEIYSAYKLYLGDDLVLQMGDPEKETYTPRTQNRMVTFEAGGIVTILLAVSDYSHFYSGLVYPPAFGSPLSLNLMRGARLGLALCLSLTGLMTAALSCYMGARMRHRNSLLFSLLCLTAALFTGYPLLHSFFALPIQPWYALEIFGSYTMTLLVVTVQNRLCSVESLYSRISEAAAAVFCVIALCYGLFSAHLTVPVMEGFSLLSAVFKSAAAIYLLAVSFCALHLKSLRGPALFYGSSFYAALLLWDRLLPSYEPIIFGWFSEWGSFILIVVIGSTLWHELVSGYAYSVAFAEEHRQLERQLAMQMEYAGQLKDQTEENRRLIHDFRQHLRAITELAVQIKSVPDTAGAQKELLEYLEKFLKSLSPRTDSSAGDFCNRAAVDALLLYYNASALRQGVQAQLALRIPAGVPLTDIEWCSVLGNLLENALEACLRQEEGKRMTAILTQQIEGILFLKVENSYDGQYSCQDGKFLSRKSSGIRFGVGLESVREIVTRHGGTMDIYPEETIFSVGITLPVHRK